MIIDCRQNSHDYFTGHIPGAIYLHEGLLRMHIGGIPVRWIPAELAQVLFRTLGLGQDNPIVVYSVHKPAHASAPAAGDGMEAGIIAYSLVRFGCRRVMILDGGLEQWRAEGYPLAQDYGVTVPSPFMVEMPVDLFIGYDECVCIKDDPAVVLLDTRPTAWYEGQGPWRKLAIFPVRSTFRQPPAGSGNPTLLKPEGMIRAILAGLEISPDKKIVCSCGTGRSAVTVFLILKWYLGYPDVVMYEGGFTEWVSHPENKTVTGKLPR